MPARKLLAFLALRDRPVHRLYVAGVIWPDMPENRSSANLRSALWSLRRLGYPVVEANGHHLGLAADVAVDVHETITLAQRVLSDYDFGNTRPDYTLMAADLLPDWYEDWVILERERFRQLRLHALEVVCERLTAAGQFAHAIDAGLAAVAGEPLRESAQRLLIKAYLAEGNLVEAVKEYSSYRTLLMDELGLEPSTEIGHLIQQVRSCRNP